MAVGTTSNYNLTRDELIREAYEEIGVLRPEDATAMSSPLQQAGIKRLNLIIREMDGKLVDRNKSLWALSEDYLILVAGQPVYSTSAGLASGIMDLVSVTYRNTSGDDTPLDIITTEQYEALTNKNDVGDPQKVYLKKHATLSSQTLYVWPVKSSVTAGSVATGSDANDYTCIQTHSSLAITKPITGDSYTQFWKLTGSGGSAWATGTDYTNGELLRYVYKRPLLDFDTASDNPDMPQEWTRYLKFRLAYDLSGGYGIGIDERQELKGQYREAESMIFPATQSRTTDDYNKSEYF